MKRSGIDEFTLLCERCGYVIEGLDRSGACPECGKPIEESLPERRVGSEWQQSSTAISWLRTTIHLLARPLWMLDRLAIERRRTQSLWWTNVIVAGVLVGVGCAITVWIWGARFAMGPEPAAGFDPLGLFVHLLLLAPPAAASAVLIIGGLNAIEERGLRLLASRRRWRLTPVAAHAVVAHGAAGWVMAAVFIAVCIPLATYRAEIRWYPFVALGRTLHPPIILAAGVLGMIGGFLFFETFAWLGLRRLKYANRVRPDAPSLPPVSEARTPA
ncbi:MAG: hypothetical protein CMJ31_09555 [Phycisphaerae bacterium]|nr:hypothetical protein [Phycisphaerae bacterium]